MPKRTVKKALVASCIVIALWFCLSIAATLLAFQALQAQNIPRAVTASRVAVPAAWVSSTITFGKVPEATLWYQGLHILTEHSTLLLDIQHSSSGTGAAPLDLAAVTPVLEDLSRLITTLPNSALAQRVLGPDTVTAVQELQPLITLAEESLPKLSTGTQTWIILLQNNDELRATGGFAGSYGVVTLQEGTLSEFVIEDIYDADGQFTGYLEPPPGVAEYLSGGNGLRLPDANWSPDFPTSAQQVLQFFALGDRDGIAGVVAVNQEVVRDFLRVTGPVPLPDYSVSLTPENIDAVLREQRGTFFPGSIQKKHLLTQAFTQTKLALQSRSLSEFITLALIIPHRLETKDIQVFAVDPDFQEVLQTQEITGVQSYTSQRPLNKSQVPGTDTPPDAYFYSVESNVGINKANAGVTRQHDIKITPATTTVTITWQNQNLPSELSVDPAALSPTASPSARTSALVSAFGDLSPQEISPDSADHLAYVNYHRLYLPTDTRVLSVINEDNEPLTWSEELVTTSTGEVFTELSFLVVVPEQQVYSVTISLENSAELEAVIRTASPVRVLLQHQSGVGSIPVRVTTPTAAVATVQTTDTSLYLE